MYRRQTNESVKNFVMVTAIDKILANAGNPCGKILMQRTEIPGVRIVAVIRDTEGNGFLPPETGKEGRRPLGR